MSDWHGYEQGNVREDRPWWRLEERVYRRTDGVSVSLLSTLASRTLEDLAEDLARADRINPLPAPPPRVGQVWVWPDTASMIVHVTQTPDGPIATFPDSVPSGNLSSSRLFAEDWPPDGAVCAAGPGAPWMLMGER